MKFKLSNLAGAFLRRNKAGWTENLPEIPDADARAFREQIRADSEAWKKEHGNPEMRRTTPETREPETPWPELRDWEPPRLEIEPEAEFDGEENRRRLREENAWRLKLLDARELVADALITKANEGTVSAMTLFFRLVEGRQLDTEAEPVVFNFKNGDTDLRREVEELRARLWEYEKAEMRQMRAALDDDGEAGQ